MKNLIRKTFFLLAVLICSLATNAQMNISQLKETLNSNHSAIKLYDAVPKIILEGIDSCFSDSKINWFLNVNKVKRKVNSNYLKSKRLYITHVQEFKNCYLVYCIVDGKGMSFGFFFIFNKINNRIDRYLCDMLPPQNDQSLIKEIIIRIDEDAVSLIND